MQNERFAMRLLTPEQQAAVPADQPIGTLHEQGLSPDSAGTGYVEGYIEAFIDHASVTDWRHAVALGFVSRSRFSEWTPFLKQSGTERTYQSDYGCAFATDGVHILIRTVEGKWISRSSQVVTLRLPATTPESGRFTKVNAARHLGHDKTPKPTRSLADEYMELSLDIG